MAVQLRTAGPALENPPRMAQTIREITKILGQPQNISIQILYQKKSLKLLKYQKLYAINTKNTNKNNGKYLNLMPDSHKYSQIYFKAMN